ncbi:MAG: hypothetical protein GY754_44390 [bacterium]|nr:hypothetical protein [bacterium]
MEKFFTPKTVAVVGASNSPFNLGATICNALKGFLKYKGETFAVNKKGEAVAGCPGYTALTEIPGEVDLAVVIVAAKHVPGVIKECAVKGIKHVIIESAGFSEGGTEGDIMQKDIDDTARANGIRIMGPNCLGTLNAHGRFCCFYGFDPKLLGELGAIYDNPGTISYVIQSGGVGVLILESLTSDVVGVNKMVSIGNKCDVDEADFIDYFEQDNTEVIAMYLESVRNGRKLMDAAKRAKKPILIYKVGRTEEGASAAMSHTAGMANNDTIFDSACKQSGIIRCKSITELHSLPKMFTHMPPMKGKKVAVFTNSGAFGGITADFLIEAGLEMVTLSPKTQEKLSKTGQIFNVANPVDLGPAMSPQTYLDIFEILLSADEVDGLLPVPSVWREFVIDAMSELVKMCQVYSKPAAIYTPNAVKKTIGIREKFQIPLFETPEEAVRALSVSYEYYAALQKKEKEAAWKDCSNKKNLGIECTC